MLRFISLTIENFGPFKGSQTIDFTSNDGVSIIWGNNGRGKTTLLNIFRYALFGKIQSRQGILSDLTRVSNIESRNDGNFGFKVILKMSNAGKNYELTRQYKLRPGISRPSKNDDYVQAVFLNQDGAILSNTDRDHILNSIMPEQVSRFFLFDGELLQEYEELLINNAGAGEKIKESIEKILGVPVLTNGTTDVESVMGEYRVAKNRAAQNDNRTMQIAASMAALDEKLKKHRSEFERLKDELTKELENKRVLEDRLSQTERIRDLLAKAKALEQALVEKTTRRNNLLALICNATKESWKGLVGTRVSTVLTEISGDIKELEEKDSSQRTAERFLEEMRHAYSKRHCHLCDRDIDDEILSKIEARIKQAGAEFSGLTSKEAEVLRQARKRYAILKEMIYPSNRDMVALYEDQIDEVTVEMSQAERNLKTIRSDIEKYGDIDGLMKLTQNYSQSLAKIDNLETGKNEESKLIAETQSSLATLEAQLNRKASGAELLAAKRRFDLCEQIYKIFESGVDAYRDKLKADVERDATALFIQISNDPDYERLEINENYGLSMVHSSGEKVPFRSAGFEHVVALALIGALHKNAPLRGPIIMDSPFGRLDPIHKDKITKVLQSMSEQIILLAYTHEIDEQLARETLGSSLLREYHLVRQTSFNTRIE